MTDALEFALNTARQAGQLLCDYSHRRHRVSTKSTDIDLVTEADLASEQLIVDAIRARFPNHTILSEEGLGDPSDPNGSAQSLQSVAGDIAGLWLVDPLDGTVNYARCYPHWGVSLALAEHGQLVLAVSYDPLREECFWAERERGAWCNGDRIRVSTAARLGEALIATGFAYKRATVADNNLAEFGAVMPRVQGIRRAGAAILDLAYVAAGRLDGYWEYHLQPWDWAPGWLLVQEAGGVVTDVRGNPWSLGAGNLVASNGALHEELLAVLQQARQV